MTEIVIRLSLAACLGAVIGLERERKEWAAGLRTHMMVCLGSALTMIVSAHAFHDILDGDKIILDPSRIASLVISGIGFIGAGTILFLKQGVVKGLTTASGLWTVAAIGLAAGGGMYFAASVTTALALIILLIIQPVEKMLTLKFKQKTVSIIMHDREKSMERANKIFENSKFEIENFSLDTTANNSFMTTFCFKKFDKAELMHLINELQSDPEVKEVIWNK